MNRINKMKKIIYIITIYIICIHILPAGYIRALPSIPIYPDNNKEVIEVKEYIKNRTKKDIDFFHLTNKSVVHAFIPYINETYKQLEKIELSVVSTILFFKYLINRARPDKIDKTIIALDKSTARTPAYPAGHAYQAYFLAKILSKKYPEKRDILNKIALECDLTRVKAGLHYPSDGRFARQLVDMLE